jgi:hypothetical protein
MAKRRKKIEGNLETFEVKKPLTKKQIEETGDVIEGTLETFEVKKPIEGLGDVIEKFTKATGIKSVIGDCEGCEQRKFLLNRIFPFKRVNKTMTDEHKAQFEVFLSECGNRVLENRITDITNHVPFLNELYKEYFGITIEVCESCSNIHKAIIRDLNKLFQNS